MIDGRSATGCLSHTRKVKNMIILLGDGMGAAHRTAARIVAKGYAQGHARGLLAMDTLPYAGVHDNTDVFFKMGQAALGGVK